MQHRHGCIPFSKKDIHEIDVDMGRKLLGFNFLQRSHAEKNTFHFHMTVDEID